MLLPKITSILFLVLPLCLFSQYPAELLLNQHCAKDSSEKYGLYLPPTHEKNQAHPIIFVFDPMARVEAVLHAFQESAIKLDCIIMVSQSAKNGPWGPILKSADALFAEAFSKFKVDTNRIYTSGFSGGSRVAALLALNHEFIDGVIGCGAGLPIQIQLPKPLEEYNFNYAGCVGTQDMNYHEHVDLQEKLNMHGINNTLLVFRGPHQWPPSEILTEALLFLENQNSVDEDRAADIRNSLKVSRYKRAQDFIQAGYAVTAINILDEIIEKNSDITWHNSAHQLKDSLVTSKQFKKHLKEIERIAIKEESLMQELRIQLTEVRALGLVQHGAEDIKSENYWITKLRSLYKSGHKSNPLLADMYMRVYRSALLTFIMGSQQFAKSNISDALQFNRVWAEADPDSAWAQYHMARLCALKKDAKKSIAYLQRAAELAPKYMSQIATDDTFEFLLEHPKFISLVEENPSMD